MNGQPLTPEQLEQAKQYILKSLPQVLEQSPEFVTFVEGVVAEKFPRRDEFARLLDQVEAHRRETQQHKSEIDARFDALENELRLHRNETQDCFAKVDKRFDKVDERLDKMDERFDKMDERIDKMDERI